MSPGYTSATDVYVSEQGMKDKLYLITNQLNALTEVSINLFFVHFNYTSRTTLPPYPYHDYFMISLITNYVTFGSVLGVPHVPFMPEYRSGANDALDMDMTDGPRCTCVYSYASALD